MFSLFVLEMVTKSGKCGKYSEGRGFTLIELMIVVAIIGILLAMLLPRVGLLIDRAREKSTAKNLKNIYMAIFDLSQRERGGFELPFNASSATTMLTGGISPSFDEIPYALLRNTLNVMGSGLSIDSNKIFDASSKALTGTSNSNINKGGWMYVSSGYLKGELFINCSEQDTFNNPYTGYMCQ